MGTLRRLVALLPLIIVVGMSLGLVTWIGYGEAHRTYPHFQHQKMAAQGEVLQNPIEGALRAGVPMRQFIGFDSLAGDLLDSDGSLVGIVALDHDGSVLFSNLRQSQAEPLRTAIDRARSEAGGRYSVATDGSLHIVVVPLRDRIGVVGNLVLAMPTDVIRKATDTKFRPFMLAVPAITFCFLVVALFASRGGMEQSSRNLHRAYAATYSVLACAVLWSIVSLYAEGIQAKSQALASSLASRVETVFELGLGLDDIEGVDRTFAAYRTLNPEIDAISLEVGGRVRIHTDPAEVGAEHGRQASWRVFQHDVPIGETGAHLVVSIPLSVVAWAVAGSVKDFAVLFIACGLLAALFLQIASAGIVKRAAAAGSESPDISPLDMIRPMLFIAVFAESLSASFLPQMLRSLAGRPELASWLFMAYFVAFAATLIPAGQIADRRGPKPVLLVGIIGAVAGLVALAYADGMLLAAAARALCGAGQGAILIGVQSYILAVARPEQRTRAAGIIVYGFNGGMISGAAIGALMVAYVGTTGIFLAGAAFAFCAMAYLLPLLTIPVPVQQAKKTKAGFAQLFIDIKAAVADLGFLRTMLLVGVPSKAVLTGVVGFALPLLLSTLGFAQGDIGQVIMLYAGAVLISSRYASAFVDRAGDSGRALVFGSLVGGVALCAVAAGAWPPAVAALHALAAPALVLGGVVLLGAAHGLINAPIVTHVADTAVAGRIGQGPTTAAYRFLERIGHVAGPPLFGQLVLLAGGEPLALAGVGIAIVLCGLFFLVSGPSRNEPEPVGSTTR